MPWAVVARDAGAYHVRVGGCAHFKVAPGLIEVAPADGVPASTIRHLLLDQVLPLALAAEGRLVLHASGLRKGERAIAIAGAAGAGKSTSAAALAREGWTVMSDDGVLIEERDGAAVAVPAYPGLRLWPEAVDANDLRERCVGAVAEYSAKLRVAPLASGDAGPAPLAHIYVLERGDAHRIERLGPRDGSMALLAHLYRADLEDRDALASQLEACASLVERLPVWRLVMPGGFSSLADAARALGAHATVGAPGQR